MGEEKVTALALMRKFIAYQFTDEPLLIKSVVVKEGLRGYIYVEAFKQTHVKQAITGIGSLRIGLYQQQVCRLYFHDRDHFSYSASPVRLQRPASAVSAVKRS